MMGRSKSDKSSSDFGKGERCFFKAVQKCPLCGFEEFGFLFKANMHGIENTHVICMKCSQVFQNPRPGEEMLAEFYKNQYITILNREDSKEGPSEHALRNALVKAKRIYRFIEPYSRLKPGRECFVLDVGSSAGVLLDQFKQRGAKTCGVEPNEKYAVYSKKKGHRVEIGIYDDKYFKSEQFDIATLSHVLEHSPDPVGMLSSIGKKLKDKGLLVVEVPNIFRPNGALNGFFQLPHMYTFSKETLLRVFFMAGFHDILEVDENFPHLRVLARKSKNPEALIVQHQGFPDYKKVQEGLQIFAWKYRIFTAPKQIFKKTTKQLARILLPKTLFERMTNIYSNRETK